MYIKRLKDQTELLKGEKILMGEDLWEKNVPKKYEYTVSIADYREPHNINKGSNNNHSEKI